MSTIKANDIQNATGGIPTVKGQKLIPTAWASFDSSGVVASTGSENISSVTNTNTGRYTVNFTTTLDNSNYAAVAITGTSRYNTSTTSFTTSAFDVNIRNDAATFVDSSISVVVMGGQP